MLRFLSSSDSRPATLSRREWLRIGGLGSLASMIGTRGAKGSESGGTSVPGFGRARSVLLIYASGGQSQLDMWDPKPDAPLEIRGEFPTIETRVPGIRLCEHMPRLARLADRYTILRTMSHDDVDHGSATYCALTGHMHPRKSSNPPPAPTDFPTYGSVLARVRPTDRFPHTAVHLNGPALVPTVAAAGQNGGLLGRRFDPLLLGDVTAESVAIPEFADLPDLPAVRHDSRRTLLETVDRHCRALEGDRRRMEMDVLYRQAYELLAARQCRQAFDLSAEPDTLRDRYGRHRTGQACLLARRLVEAGVPWITVIWNHCNRGQDKSPDDPDEYGWDTHNDIFDVLKQQLLPRFDATFSTLLQDLDERGLLDRTLVVCMGEFGRAPQVALEAKFKGSSPGRRHWASVYSIVLTGAGVVPGRAVGESDAFGAFPVTAPHTPGDLSATMFSALGINPAGHYADSEGRPFPICTGQPIQTLY